LHNTASITLCRPNRFELVVFRRSVRRRARRCRDERSPGPAFAASDPKRGHPMALHRFETRVVHEHQDQRSMRGPVLAAFSPPLGPAFRSIQIVLELIRPNGYFTNTIGFRDEDTCAALYYPQCEIVKRSECFRRVVRLHQAERENRDTRCPTRSLIHQLPMRYDCRSEYD